jgi:hypothetical protein
MYGVDKDGNPVPFRVDTRAEKYLLVAWRVAVLLTLVAIAVSLWVR